ncbi:MAG: hypothetical protein ABI835_03215, partial [Chloroflexota bacterium]
PFVPRLMILLPACALLAAIGLNQIYELANRGLARIAKPVALLAPLGVALLMVGMGIQNWNHYVSNEAGYGTPSTLISRYLADQPPSMRAYLVSDGLNYRAREFEFLVPGRLSGNLTPQEVEAFTPADSPTLLLMTAEQRDLFDQLKQRYPEQPAQAGRGNSPGEIGYYVFQLP